MPIGTISAGTYVQPGYQTGFVPDLDATGKLQVAFSRNPNEFALPKYAKYDAVKKSTGLFCRFGREEMARMLDADMKEYVWADGADRPKGASLENFRFEQYSAQRFDFPEMIGDLAADEAAVNLDQANKQFQLQKAMTYRTAKVVDVLSTVGNWETGHYAYITALGLGSNSWEASTTSDLTILESLQYAILAITKATVGKVNESKVNDMLLVANPNTWSKIAKAQELRDYVKQQPSAPQIVEGSKWGLSTLGMPDKLYGIDVVYENAVKVTNQKGGTRAADFVMADGDVFLLCRPGTVDSSTGGGAFSTLHLFFKEEFTVENKADVWNRRREQHVVDHYDVALLAPVTGFWFRGVTDASSS